ncbi:MAG: hypothetical protein ACIAQZ_04720 [Sedimentisphaeraceae bacterium JB056]
MKRKMIIFAFLAFAVTVQAKTWQISDDLSLKEVSGQQTDFEIDFAMLKRAADQNKPQELLVAVLDMEKKYPDITSGDDWKAYVEAEEALANEKWKKSSELFTAFLDNYPVSRFYNAALEREYEIASAFLAGQKRRAFGIFMIRGYDDGEVMMRKISDKAGNSSIANRALKTLAESFESRKLYFEAYDVWTEIAVRWPTGESGEESLLGMARNMHSAYNGPNYDAAPVKSAEGYYSQYQLRYPQLAEKKGVEQQYNNAVEQIAFKYYNIANYYERTDDIESAMIYYNYVIDKSPDTEVAKLASGKMQGISDRPQEIVKIKPEDKSLWWRLWHFFDFEAVEKL